MVTASPHFWRNGTELPGRSSLLPTEGRMLLTYLMQLPAVPPQTVGQSGLEKAKPSPEPSIGTAMPGPTAPRPRPAADTKNSLASPVAPPPTAGPSATMVRTPFGNGGR